MSDLFDVFFLFLVSIFFAFRKIPKTIPLLTSFLPPPQKTHTQKSVVVMRKGRVAESGTHASLMASKGEYYSLVSKQSGGLEGGDLAPHQREAGPSTSVAAAAGGGGGDDATAAAAVAAAAAAAATGSGGSGGSTMSPSSAAASASPKAAPLDDDDNDGVVSPNGGGSDLLPSGSGAALESKAKR